MDWGKTLGIIMVGFFPFWKQEEIKAAASLWGSHSLLFVLLMIERRGNCALRNLTTQDLN
jgi:hypothetical protein